MTPPPLQPRSTLLPLSAPPPPTPRSMYDPATADESTSILPSTRPTRRCPTPRRILPRACLRLVLLLPLLVILLAVIFILGAERAGALEQGKTWGQMKDWSAKAKAEAKMRGEEWSKWADVRREELKAWRQAQMQPWREVAQGAKMDGEQWRKWAEGRWKHMREAWDLLRGEEKAVIEEEIRRQELIDNYTEFPSNAEAAQMRPPSWHATDRGSSGAWENDDPDPVEPVLGVPFTPSRAAKRPSPLDDSESEPTLEAEGDEYEDDGSAEQAYEEGDQPQVETMEIPVYNVDDRLPAAPAPIFLNTREKQYPLPERVSVDERYLAYLPHSGFHNQRVALENALRLSLILNRTLLLPPALLGSTLSWYAPPALQKLWDRHSKEGRLADCLSYELAKAEHDAGTASVTVPPARMACLEAEKWTYVDWSWVLDWSEVEAEPGLRLATRSNMSKDWFFAPRDGPGSGLGVSKEEVYTVPDPSRYPFQIRDDRADVSSRGRYEDVLWLDELQKLSGYKVLEFGSLYGTARLQMTKEENLEKAGWAKRGMIFGNSWLDKQSNLVRKRLGGRRGYVALHLRVGDGWFKTHARENMDNTLENALHNMFGVRSDQAKERIIRDAREELSRFSAPLRKRSRIEGELSKRATYPSPHSFDLAKRPVLPLITSPEHLSYLHPSLKCSRPLRRDHPQLNNPVYIATDAPDPRNHPDLALFFAVFPCTFTLEDFVAGEDPLPRAEQLDRMRNNLDGVKLKKFLVPLFEAIVVAKSSAVTGTTASTFSRYVTSIMSPWHAALAAPKKPPLRQ